MNTLTLKLESVIKLTSEDFFKICQENPDLKLERTAEGELIIMSPTGGETGKRNSDISRQLWLWNEQYRLNYRDLIILFSS